MTAPLRRRAMAAPIAPFPPNSRHSSTQSGLTVRIDTRSLESQRFPISSNYLRANLTKVVEITIVMLADRALQAAIGRGYAGEAGPDRASSLPVPD